MIPQWSQLLSIGESRAIRSSLVWLVIVPIAAKSLADLPEKISLRIFGAELVLVLQLPFTWMVFYFAAVAFSAASILYVLFCPSIVRQYLTYEAYDRDRRLEPYLLETGERLGLTRAAIKKEPPTQQFWLVRNEADKSRANIRLVAVCCYAVGFALIGWVFIENFIAVVRRT